MDAKQTRQGVLLALAAYFIWGYSASVTRLITTLPADEILTHRVIWSFLYGGADRHLPPVVLFKTLIQTPQKIFMLAVSAVLIGGNWLLFIWAVNNHHMLEASLGYFINPLSEHCAGDDFPRQAIPPDAMAGGDSGDMWRVSPAVDFWFATYYRAGAGILVLPSTALVPRRLR